MKYLITLSLIVISLSDEGYNKFIINIKQQLSKQVVDFPENYERYIKDLRGYTNVFKTTINYNQLRNFFTGKGFPIDVYASCLEATFKTDSYFEKSDYVSGGNNQYSLNQYVSSCHKSDNNLISLIAIKGRYSGTMQPVTQNNVICRGMRGRRICRPVRGNFRGPRRGLNYQEMELVKKTLKIKYFQEALDQLNRLN